MNAVNTPREGAPRPSRRQRARAATEAEILAVSREILRDDGIPALSLREVGRRMGMTASGLYRYVDGFEALLDGLIAALLVELNEAVVLRAQAITVPRDPREVLGEAARAFREWAVTHPAEFGLVFGTRPPSTTRGEREHDAGHSFGRTFAQLFSRLVDPEAPEPASETEPLDLLPDDLARAYVRAWVRLLGTVSVEVYGHLEWTGADPEQVFETELADMRRWLGELVARGPAAGALDVRGPR